MHKSKDKLVVMVIYWQSFSPPSSQKVNTSSSPSNGCPCILIVTKTCRYWPSTVLLSYHMSCAAQLIHLIAVPLLFFLPLPLYAHLMLSGSQLPPPSTFDSKTDHAEQSTAGKLIKPPVTSVIVSRDKHLLGSVKEEGWEGGRLNWWGRSETVQCLFSVYIQKTIECRHWSLSCKLIGGVENSIRETNVEIQSTKTECTSWSRLPSMCC